MEMKARKMDFNPLRNGNLQHNFTIFTKTMGFEYQNMGMIGYDIHEV